MDNRNLHSHEAEQAVLGGLLLDNQAWKMVEPIIKQEDFYSTHHQTIFTSLTTKLASGKICDVLTLCDKLKEQSVINEVGGEAYIFGLAKNTPSTANIIAYAKIVKERANRRKVAIIADELKSKIEREDIEKVLSQTTSKLALVQQSLNQSESLKSVSIFDFLAQEIKPRRLLLSPWLPEQGLAMIYAKRGVGKTFVGLNIAYALASGGAFLVWKAEKPTRVLYIDGEMPASVMQQRLAAIVEVHDKEATCFEILTPDMLKYGMPDLSTVEGQQSIEHLVEKADVIIVDNISTLCRKTNENEADGWLPVQEWALRLRTQGKSVIFIHHASKNGGQRGTSKREDVLDTVIVLKHPADYNPMDGAKFEIHFEKSRGFSGKDAEPLLASLVTDQYGKQKWAVETIESSTYQQVISLYKEKLSPREIAEELDINKSTVSRHLKRAKQEGMINDKY